MKFKEPHEARYILQYYHNMPLYHELANKYFILMNEALNSVDKRPRIWFNKQQGFPSVLSMVVL